MCKKHGNEFMVCINDEYFCEKCFDEKDYEEYLEEKRKKNDDSN